jgi:hypothetical protein
MHDTSISHGDCNSAGGCAAHVALNGLPDIENFSAAKGTDVVNAFQQYAVLEAVADGSGVILDTGGQFVGGQVLSIYGRSPWVSYVVKWLHMCIYSYA